jgi:tRNA-specific 2-thiouridylase
VRRGLKIAAGEALYVTRLDAARRLVEVGPKAALIRRYLRLRDVNWLGEEALHDGDDPVRVFVKIRSTRPAAAATVNVCDGEILVALDDGEAGVSPGQACVFYEHPGAGAAVLGGGFIAAAYGEDRHTIEDAAARRTAAGPG